MVWVNLLPWREGKMRTRRRRWQLALLLLVLVLLVATLPIRGQQVLNQQRENTAQRIEDARLRVERQSERLSTLQREKAMLSQQLQQRITRQHESQQWRTFMQQLTLAMPQTLWLTSLSKTQNTLSIAGVCESVQDLEAFRQRLSQRAPLGQARTGSLNRSGDGTLLFRLEAALSTGEPPDE